MAYVSELRIILKKTLHVSKDEKEVKARIRNSYNQSPAKHGSRQNVGRTGCNWLTL